MATYLKSLRQLQGGFHYTAALLWIACSNFLSDLTALQYNWQALGKQMHNFLKLVLHIIQIEISHSFRMLYK